MLGKLLKYDLLALSRILVPVHVALIALGVVGSGAGFFGFASYEASDVLGTQGSSIAATIGAIAMLALMLSGIGLFSATVATFVVVLVRFYQNLFTDEGYLTLTLPVTAVQQLASKAIAGLIWMVVDAVVVMGCASAMAFASFGFTDLHELSDFAPLWMLGIASGDFLGMVNEDFAPIRVIGMLLRCLLLMASTLLIAYFSLALGAAAAARHKVAAGIAFFVGIQWVIGMVQGAMNIMAVVLLSDISDLMFSVLGGQSLLIQIAAGVGSWFACVYLLRHKVNLP